MSPYGARDAWIRVLPWYFVKVARHHREMRKATKRAERQRVRREIALATP